VHDVRVLRRPLRRFAEVAGEERAAFIVDQLEPQAAAALDDRTIVNVNSTASGGGVAEMLRVLLGYVVDAGVEVRWLVMEGDRPFFVLTKRIHNHLYGSPGDGGPLGPAEHEVYQEILRSQADGLAEALQPGDIALIHDPQPAGLAETAASAGAIVVWRCHVGLDEQNENSDVAWEFLRPYLEPHVDHYVFSRREFAPAWIPEDRLSAIPPSIDPFAPKNQELAPEVVESILTHVGLVSGRETDTRFEKDDGEPGRVERVCDIVRSGPAPGPDVPVVTQVSRWDPIKDMLGVMRGFVEHVDAPGPAHLVLAGPSVAAVSDDPEGAQVLEDCRRAWEDLPESVQQTVTLACLPMDDVDENAAIVNALQRHSSVVTQKSLAEGFGLTVSEALLKGRAVVASAVGGIVDQVVDGETGLLVREPSDLAEFGGHLTRLLTDPDLASRLGEAAREATVAGFLGDTQLERWLGVLGSLVDTDGSR